MELSTLRDHWGSVPAAPSSVRDPVRDQVLALRPCGKTGIRCGATTRGSRMQWFPTGWCRCSYSAVPTSTSPTSTAQPRPCARQRDEWIALGLTEDLRLLSLTAYAGMIGLELDHLVADGCITKAPSGGERAGKSPVDRAKRGMKRSQLTERQGIALVTEPAPANVRDHTLLPAHPRCPRRPGESPRSAAGAPSPESGCGLRLPRCPRRPGRQGRTHRPTRGEGPDLDRPTVGGRAHEFLDEQLRQTASLHGKTQSHRRLLPRSNVRNHHCAA